MTTSSNQVAAVQAADIDATFSKTTNLASSALGTRVLACSDDYFAAASNLLTPGTPVHKPGVFVHTGAWYDGWETRRHNPAEYDWVVVRLGVGSGVVQGVEIDTAHFHGNYGEKVVVEGVYLPGNENSNKNNDSNDQEVVKPDYPHWRTILPIQPCGPSQRQAWKLPSSSSSSSPFTHIRVRMYPDGGFARLRLYGYALPPPPPPPRPPASSQAPQPLEELSSALMGGQALRASDEHFTPSTNLLLPGRGKDMGDGWETARSRTPGHVDWAIVRLGVPAASVARVVVDTKDFRGNFPRAVRVHGLYLADEVVGGDAGAGGGRSIDRSKEPQVPSHDDPRWTEVVRGDRPCKADEEHVFEGDQLVASPGPITHVKLTLVPDGGVKRFRIWGQREV